jgi:heme/copper-type cytochrome/quinol oxidase subunit 3
VSDLASHSTDYSVVEQESPDILSRNLRVGAQLWSSSTLFFFAAFLFAYFYLRALNTHGQFKPKAVDGPTAWGTAIMLCVVASAALVFWGAIDQRADRRPLWRAKGVVALVLGVVAVILQIVSWSQLAWGPTNGGYASVFLGWTGLYALFVFCSMYWLETTLAVSFRYRNETMAQARVEPGDASGDPGRTAHDIANPVALNTAELDALTSYFVVLAAVGVVSWIVLYLL